MNLKTLPAAVLMPEYEALLQEGTELPLVVSGESMLPFLRPGRDTVFLKRPDGALRAGDIAFYRRENGAYILHRVVRAERGQYWFLGDAQLRVEGPLPAGCVLARVIAVRRDDRLIRSDSRLWRGSFALWHRMRGQRLRLLKAYRILFYRSAQNAAQ